MKPISAVNTKSTLSVHSASNNSIHESLFDLDFNKNDGDIEEEDSDPSSAAISIIANTNMGEEMEDPGFSGNLGTIPELPELGYQSDSSDTELLLPRSGHVFISHFFEHVFPPGAMGRRVWIEATRGSMRKSWTRCLRRVMVIHRKSISVKIKKRHGNTNLKRGQIVSYASQSRLSLVSIVTLSNSVYTHLWSDVCKTLVKLSPPAAPEVLSNRSVDSEGLESV